MSNATFVAENKRLNTVNVDILTYSHGVECSWLYKAIFFKVFFLSNLIWSTFFVQIQSINAPISHLPYKR